MGTVLKEDINGLHNVNVLDEEQFFSDKYGVPLLGPSCIRHNAKVRRRKCEGARKRRSKRDVPSLRLFVQSPRRFRSFAPSRYVEDTVALRKHRISMRWTVLHGKYKVRNDGRMLP